MLLGIDIGGSNTKFALFDDSKGFVEFGTLLSFAEGVRSIDFIPLHLSKELGKSVNELCRKHGIKKKGLSVCVTSTAPIMYRSIREGVGIVIDVAESIFDEPYFLNMHGSFHDKGTAKKHPFEIACREYVGTWYLLSKVLKLLENGVFVDVGTTSTSIVPVKNWNLIHLNDEDRIYNRLLTSEGIWSGAVYSPVSSIVKKVPLEDGMANISGFPVFTGEIYYYLKYLKLKDIKGIEHQKGLQVYDRRIAMNEIASLVLARGMLRKGDVERISRYIFEKQVEDICKGIQDVGARTSLEQGVPLGKGEFLAVNALKRAGVREIKELGGRRSISAPLEGMIHLFNAFLKD